MTAESLGRQVVSECCERGVCVAVAESLTGGALASSIVDVPGASTIFRGGAVTYAADTKASVLGVSEARLAVTGPVDHDVACQMAAGVAKLFGADFGVSTTGVAGPGPSDGHLAGCVWIGWWYQGESGAEQFLFPGDRATVRCQTVDKALETILRLIKEK